MTRILRFPLVTGAAVAVALSTAASLRAQSMTDLDDATRTALAEIRESGRPLVLLIACETSKLPRNVHRFRNSPCTPKRRRLTNKRGGRPAPPATVGTESTPGPKNE